MKNKILLGAIAGDVMGSVYEFNPIKRTDIELFVEKEDHLNDSTFTDDTVLTVAIADWLIKRGSLAGIMQDYGRRYPYAGYGGKFFRWLYEKEPQHYNSFGNGSAMRVSPVGWIFDSLEETLEVAKESAEVTHNHPEGIKGAQAIAACIFMARKGMKKEDIKRYVEDTFNYDLDRTCDEIRLTYSHVETCQESTPESIICFLESKDYESAIRLCISLGGDADTMAAMAGSIAEAYYGGVPELIRAKTLKRLPDEFIDVLYNFGEKFNISI